MGLESRILIFQYSAPFAHNRHQADSMYTCVRDKSMSTHARAREGTRPRGGLPPNRRLHRARRMTHEQVEKQTRDIRGEPPAAALKRPPTYSLVLAPTCHQVQFVTNDTAPRHVCPHYASHAHAHSLARTCTYDVCMCMRDTERTLQHRGATHRFLCTSQALHS